MPLISLRPAPPRSTPLTSTTTSVLRHLDAALSTDLLLGAAPALAGAGEAALLVEGRDGHRVSGGARELLATTAAALLVVTADPARPAWVAGLGADAARVAWCPWPHLAGVVDAALEAGASSAGVPLTAVSRTLLAELSGYWEAHGLRSLEDVVVVAGRTAWPEYLRTGAVLTAPGPVRAGTTHVGFSVDGAFADVVPAIEQVHREVRFTPAAAQRHRSRGESALADVIDAALGDGTRPEGATCGVLLLSAPDAAGTVRLGVPVPDDAAGPAGRRGPWAAGRRYTHLARLRGTPTDGRGQRRASATFS